MAIETSLTKSAKVELLKGIHSLGPARDTIKLALYTNAATMDKTVTQYSATNEVAANGDYVAGGVVVTQADPVNDGDDAVWDLTDISLAATITARCGLLYNSTEGNKSLITLDFGQDRSSVSGLFDIVWPAPTTGVAVLTIR